MQKTIVRSNRKQLAIKNGTYNKGITIHKLIERDGNICYLCQKEVDFNKNSTHPLYPNIEHVIPISKGGTHSWDNVKVACRGCNVHKSSMLLEVYLEKTGKVIKVEEESKYHEFTEFPEFPGFEEILKQEAYARKLEAQIENTNREIDLEKKSKPQIRQQKPKKKTWLKKLLSILI